jgi:hypothetical protein
MLTEEKDEDELYPRTVGEGPAVNFSSTLSFFDKKVL